MIGGGDETSDRIMTAMRKEFDFGAWDIGSFRFKGRQISQMPKWRDRVRHGAVQT